jgi:cystathionine beta-lyase
MNDQLQALEIPAAILWCNPQNPGGTVYSSNQIQKLVGIGAKHGCLIVSDEIWADLILDDDQHIPLGRIAPTNQPTITLMAATKTFNIAGFGCAIAIIPEPTTRQRFLDTQIAMPHITPLAYAVTESCLREGWDWHHELLQALRANRQTVLGWATQYPELKVTTGQATFLAWIESHQRPDLAEHFAKCGVRLSSGTPFGSETAVRLNFGCSPATLSEALRRMNAR